MFVLYVTFRVDLSCFELTTVDESCFVCTKSGLCEQNEKRERWIPNIGVMVE